MNANQIKVSHIRLFIITATNFKVKRKFVEIFLVVEVWELIVTVAVTVVETKKVLPVKNVIKFKKVGTAASAAAPPAVTAVVIQGQIISFASRIPHQLKYNQIQKKKFQAVPVIFAKTTIITIVNTLTTITTSITLTIVIVTTTKTTTTTTSTTTAAAAVNIITITTLTKVPIQTVVNKLVFLTAVSIITIILLSKIIKII